MDLSGVASHGKPLIWWISVLPLRQRFVLLWDLGHDVVCVGLSNLVGQLESLSARSRTKLCVSANQKVTQNLNRVSVRVSRRLLGMNICYCVCAPVAPNRWTLSQANSDSNRKHLV